MITLTAPLWLKTLILPPVPSFISADTGEMKPGSALLVDASGRVCPVGHTVRKLLEVASWSIVTLIATDVASAGIPEIGPVICTSSVWLAPIGAAAGTPTVWPAPRVSRTRTGVIPTKSDGATVVGVVVVLGVVGVLWGGGVHGLPPSIVPAASVAGTAAAAITAQRISGDGCRSSDVGFWVIGVLLAPDRTRDVSRLPAAVWGNGRSTTPLPGEDKPRPVAPVEAGARHL